MVNSGIQFRVVCELFKPLFHTLLVIYGLSQAEGINSKIKDI